MHFRFSSRLAKSVKAKCRTISNQYADYRRNRKIAKSTKSPVAQSPQTQHGAANPWQGEPYRFANDPDDWEKNLVSGAESGYGSDYGSDDSISVEEEELGCEFDVDAFIEWWLHESSLFRFW
ncbi:hypothetical protein NW754_004860 [Fusarium falciforme]|uniref:Uncharacterized protein n=1 Tax=Fusarium falciforme TaxID=195108 RepID=A0A9W8UX87_9HYPO|nr:hypothetical protein NW754_004860 [Fusarium falciforme]KAJ4181333.1 hypothetical protein NW755_011118 [Fusarium falciforme]KAJ4208553.1 hypothetical protein NW767_001660 [Fusarium falciforme]KAJ4257735.1 hypothetical protein NW757_003361 [Fusarium falciforme]